MTNINCSSNCVFQKDGKCNLNIANANSLTPFSDCSYFVEKVNKNDVIKAP